MLKAVRGGRPGAVPGTRTRDRGATELLLRVLDGVGSYDGLIAGAERDEDPELAGFLRELRRQDIFRSKGAARLLRRPPE